MVLLITLQHYNKAANMPAISRLLAALAKRLLGSLASSNSFYFAKWNESAFVVVVFIVVLCICV